MSNSGYIERLDSSLHAADQAGMPDAASSADKAGLEVSKEVSEKPPRTHALVPLSQDSTSALPLSSSTPP